MAKKLVKREVTRIVTPGTATDAHLLRSHENNYLAAVARTAQRAGVAHVDISTGEFRVTEMDAAEVAGALEHLGAREVLFPGRSAAARRRKRNALSAHRAGRLDLQLRLRGAHAARSFPAAVARWLRSGESQAAVGAAGAILHYLRDTQRAALEHLDRPTYYDRAEAWCSTP